jgi:formylglycine-generating enzyme required for sulfatase activity
MVLPGFSPFTIEADIGGRLAGSLFFPRRARVEGILTASDPLEALRLGASRYADWSFAGEPTAAYQIPQELSEGAYRSGPAASEPAAREAMEGILEASLRFTVTRAGLRDRIRAKTLTENAGLAPSPVTLLRSAGDMLARLSERPGAAEWLADLLPQDAASMAASSEWSRKSAAPPTEIGVEAGSETSAGSVEIQGLRFREIPGGAFTMGGAVPRRVTVDGFWIAVTEVSPETWGAFLEANPEWRAANTESLRERGLVTPDYLGDVPSSPGGVGGISWYAAEAYCRWLTGLLPPALSVYEARLPLEAEWEYAAALNTASSGYTPEGLFDGRWEWCADPFAPLDFFPAPAEYIRAVSSPERSLRGGAWINPPGSVGPETRASLPPDLCSAFVSFRPVLARRVSP